MYGISKKNLLDNTPNQPLNLGQEIGLKLMMNH